MPLVLLVRVAWIRVQIITLYNIIRALCVQYNIICRVHDNTYRVMPMGRVFCVITPPPSPISG